MVLNRNTQVRYCRYSTQQVVALAALVVVHGGDDGAAVLLVRPVRAVRPPVAAPRHGHALAAGAAELRPGAGGQRQQPRVGGARPAQLHTIAGSQPS